MKLRTKIQLFSSIFILILMLLINASIYLLFYKQSAESELDEISTQTDEMVKIINENPEISKKDLLDAFIPSNGMIQVISKSEDVILRREKPVEHGNLDGAFYNKEIQKITKNDLGHNIAIVSKPIVWENDELVTVQVSKQLLTLEETMRTLFYVLVIASLVMLIPAILGGWVLGRVLLQPIQTLIQTMKRNTDQQKWEKIAIKGRSRDELYEMKKTFNEMIDHLEANFHKQEVFVSDASHELKTPIAIIKSYAQMLERRKDMSPELFNESIETIESEADRMQSLVEQMLLLAKNRNQAKWENVDMVALADNVIHTFQGANERAIRLDIKTDVEGIRVNGNAGQLQQILYILVDNALKYSDDAINITLDHTDDMVQLKVIDYGAGIPEEEQEHIFERFYRVDKARSRETGGTGLGLSIAKTIAEAHGGALGVESHIGLGTIFTLRLPIMNNES
ncbi:MAG TPA: ATP-binding protein [Virgibacillus sp.]|nr:ATP-binding protein [Virgibacillus sp.]